ncbi:uncharacterized protein F4822DRAFT_432253 [Hypoxylon trugodes]|uniref:uncharacterized protein n=1 Tax=Hypoxylon trugodes TaxID=326681 RepID=UPI0021A0FA2B|nr:uncharacterized protein F4822DRAFT_432253 [Hypoxylon trugodes]KAI1385402.1 hypothetical protein F4822DRAFT_432253 [Hypoxylon trugodes]
MAPKKIITIPLKPSPDEHDLIPQNPIRKLLFTELLTCNTHSMPAFDHTKNHPDIDDGDNDDQPESQYALSTTGTSSLTGILQAAQVFDNTKIDGEVSENADTIDEVGTSFRVILYPGKPPFALQTILPASERSFRIYFHGNNKPLYAFEDLCRSAKEMDVLNILKAASFVLDTETLSGLFKAISMLNGHVIHGKNRKESGAYKSANDHYKDTLKPAWSIGASEGNTPTQLNVYKRVVSYVFGSTSLVVEDEMQVSRTNNACKLLETSQLKHQDCEDPEQDRAEKEILFQGQNPHHVFEGLRLCVSPDLNEDRNIMMSQLWFSHSKHALVARYRKPFKVDSGFPVSNFAGYPTYFDGGGMQESDEEAEDGEIEDEKDGKAQNRKQTGDDWGGKKGKAKDTGGNQAGGSLVDRWAAGQDVNDDLKELEQLLLRIKRLAITEAKKGHNKFILKHLRWEMDSLVVRISLR